VESGEMRAYFRKFLFFAVFFLETRQSRGQSHLVLFDAFPFDFRQLWLNFCHTPSHEKGLISRSIQAKLTRIPTNNRQ
jgi:hypothetical protein